MPRGRKPNQERSEKQKRDWLKLPSDVTRNILYRVGVIDILENAQKDPNARPPLQDMCKHAVDRSQGQLVDLTIVDFTSFDECKIGGGGFDGTSHFGMWQSEVLDALFQQGIDIAIEENKPEDVEERNWLTINRLACGSTMNDHITSFNQLVTDLMNMDEVFKDQDLALILLGSLSEEYELLETTLLNGKDDVSLSEVCDALYSKELRRKDKQISSSGDAKKRDCPRLKTKDNHYKGKAVAEANVTKCDDEESDLSLATSWKIVTLKGVRYSPKLKKDLISVGTLEYKGFEVREKDGVMKIISGVLIVMKGIQKINNMYHYKGRTVVGNVAAIIDGDRNSEAVKLWHMRLRHAKEKSLNLLIKQGLLKGLSSYKLDLYEHCINEKTTRVKFGITIHKTQGILDYVHSDVWGPSKTRSLGGRHYYVTFVDDFSQRVWVYTLKTKDEAEAVTYACHLVNHLPSTAIDRKTPFEKWYGKPATDYDSLHVFGSAAYYHVKESKLDPRAKKALFMGITSGIKGYRLWYPETKKTIFSRDVIFNESAMLTKVNVEQLDGTPKKVEFERIIIPVDRETDDNSPMVERDYEEEEVQTKEPPQQQHESIATNKPKRNTKRHDRLNDTVACASLIVADDVPTTYSEAKAIRCKWVYAKKEVFPSQDDVRYKARLVAKGYAQNEGIVYNEVFSPVVKHSFIRILLALVAQLDLELVQMDVKTAFLHGKLHKSLYGLKETPRQWYKRFDKFMMESKYTRSKYDHCIYLKKLQDGSFVYLLLYVDDMLIASQSLDEIEKLKTRLKSEFEMKELGEAKMILGMQIVRDRKLRKLCLTQKQYLRRVLKHFRLDKQTK
ncbi:retrovirus-related pol polyprotein from transposon TNT 1-94 [Tanacetum coccineum]|uniref:Retrovirus-related pol polyprotein from transposon TNT 1-94 n=1 Tax=Tanacetum coccineum TaxID=301880 RepID=A0ABQ5FGQ2_9ASTR